MRRSMESALWRFSTTRMLQEYTERLYLPAAGVETARHGRPTHGDGGRLTTLPPRISLALALHNHQPVGNFGWVFAEVYEPGVRAHDRCPRATSRRAAVAPLHRAAADVARRRAPRCHRAPALAGDPRPGRDPGRRLLRAGPCLAAGARSHRAAHADGRRAGVDVRTATAWRVARRARVGAGPADLARRLGLPSGRSSTTRISAPPPSPRRTCGARTRPRTRGTCCGSSARSRDCATGSRSARSTRSSTTCAEHATEAGDRVGMMGDDGEKFGAWPTTWQHCWGEGRWVERFFEALEANADWLTTTTPSAWLADHPPIGRVYVPTGSYAEMGEWALPADESLVFSDLLHRAQDEHRPEARWLRGAFWRNFQVKYREINDLHKQMLRASGAVAAMPDGPEREVATDHLYAGQSNDCYWHGLFGGIYISHMRLATYEHLIAAEDLAETATDTLVAAECRDLDMDGVDEVRLADRRAGRDGRSRRGRRHRRLGHPGRAPRARRGDAATTRGVPRDPARVRGGRGPGRRRRWRFRGGWWQWCRGCRAGVDPRRRPREGAGARGAARLRPLRTTVRARPGARARRLGGRLGPGARGRSRRRGRWRVRARGAGARPARHSARGHDRRVPPSPSRAR